MVSRGLDVNKLAIVPNGVLVDEAAVASTALPPPLRTVLEAAHAQGRTLVGYAGSHGLPNALDVLVDAAAQLRDEPFTFVMVGDGHEKARLAERALALGLSHVHWMATHADLPLWHRPQQADGLHARRLRRAALGGSGQ
jgi:hypothetical protein